MTKKDRQQWYNFGEAAAYLGITELNLRNLYTKRIIPFYTRQGVHGIWFKQDDMNNVSARLITNEDVSFST